MSFRYILILRANNRNVFLKAQLTTNGDRTLTALRHSWANITKPVNHLELLSSVYSIAYYMSNMTQRGSGEVQSTLNQKTCLVF
jgi:hypothetical protein